MSCVGGITWDIASAVFIYKTFFRAEARTHAKASVNFAGMYLIVGHLVRKTVPMAYNGHPY